MVKIIPILSVAVLLLVPAESSGIISGITDQVCRNVTGVFQVFSYLSKVAIIYDVNDDSLLNCLTGQRIRFDGNAQEAAYLIQYKGGPGAAKNVTFSVTAGATPDVFFYTRDDEPGNQQMALMPYSDYKTCAIVIIEDQGKRCELFVLYELRDYVPRNCQQQFTEICGAAVPKYNREMCNAGDGGLLNLF